MSTHHWGSPLPITSPSLDDVAFNRDHPTAYPRSHIVTTVKDPRDCDYNSTFPVLSTITVNHQLFDRQRLVPESTSSFSGIRHPRHEHQVYHRSDATVPASTHVYHIQAPDSLNFWSPSNMQIISNVSPAEDMTSAPYSAYDLGRIETPWNTRLPDSYPNNQPLLRPVAQDTYGIGAHFRGDPDTLPRSLYEVPVRYPVYSNDQTIPGPFPHDVPLHNPFSLSSHLSVTGPDSRSYYSVCHPPYQGSTESARRRRPARAIEYNGLWIDETELQQGLADPNGNISIHQCRWEEDRSSCGLWVKVDKSCMNLHIQKWHGGKPGGDKLKTDCRWSGCGMVMLKESIVRHVVNIHLEQKWECQGCGKEIARNDAYGRHAARSNSKDCRTSGALLTYSADAKVVNARAALDGGGRLRYAGA